MALLWLENKLPYLKPFWLQPINTVLYYPMEVSEPTVLHILYTTVRPFIVYFYEVLHGLTLYHYLFRFLWNGFPALLEKDSLDSTHMTFVRFNNHMKVLEAPESGY